MDYIVERTVPKNTLKSAPLWEEIYLPKGMITKIGYYFPKGCAGLAHLTIWHNGVQQWPRSADLSYYGDGILREFGQSYQLPEEQNLIRVRCWNLDDTYQHTVSVYFTVEKAEAPGWLGKMFSGPPKRET